MENHEDRSCGEQANGANRDYAVGRGKPPKHSRFKPGQSGNPSGRRKGSKNTATILRDLLNRKVTIREGGRSRKVTLLEAMLTRVVENSLKGDVKSAAFLLAQYSAQVSGEVETADLSEDDREVLEEYVERRRASPNERKLN